VEAVEYFLLPFPAPFKVSRFRVCFRFQRLLKKSNASEFASASSFFLQNASASTKI